MTNDTNLECERCHDTDRVLDGICGNCADDLRAEHLADLCDPADFDERMFDLRQEAAYDDAEERLNDARRNQ